jgi:hypothetical protein
MNGQKLNKNMIGHPKKHDWAPNGHPKTVIYKALLMGYNAKILLKNP